MIQLFTIAIGSSLDLLVSRRRNSYLHATQLAGPNVTKHQLAGLVGIRGVAAIWVLLFHVQAFAADLWLPQNIWFLRDGWMGVDLFFMLSGFVLMHAHQRDFQKLSGRAVVEFIRLRVFRVYPLATAVLALIVGAVFVVPGFADWYRGVHSPQDFSFVAFVKTLLLATRWAPPFAGDWNQPVWSLSVELLAYAVFPILAFALVRLKSLPLVVLAIALSIAFPVALMFAMGLQNENNIGYLALVRVAGFFTAGLALYQFYKLVPLGARWADALAGVAVLLLLIAASVGTPWLMLPAFAAFILSGAAREGFAARLLSSSVADFLGRVSFPIYLLHLTPLLLLRYAVVENGLGPVETWGLTAVVLAACIALAWVLHYTVEMPPYDWAKKRFPMTRAVQPPPQKTSAPQTA